MDGKIEKFENAELGANIRVIDREGEPWFVAKDVADALGYNEESRVGMLFKHIPDEWKGVNPISTPGGTQDMLCISEQGLYFFLGRSDKAAALPFQKWLARDVLPSIRKHGAYMTPKTIYDMIASPRAYAELLLTLDAERDRREILEDRDAVFGNRTHYGALSRFNGRPRIDPVRGYLRTTKTTIIEEVTEHQRRLFDWS